MTTKRLVTYGMSPPYTMYCVVCSAYLSVVVSESEDSKVSYVRERFCPQCGLLYAVQDGETQ